jgi:hypothetical protein
MPPHKETPISKRDREWAELLDVPDEDWDEAVEVCRRYATTHPDQVSRIAVAITRWGIGTGPLLAVIEEGQQRKLDL